MTQKATKSSVNSGRLGFSEVFPGRLQHGLISLWVGGMYLSWVNQYNLKLRASVCMLLSGPCRFGPDVAAEDSKGQAGSSLSRVEKTWAVKAKPLEGPSAQSCRAQVYQSLP